MIARQDSTVRRALKRRLHVSHFRALAILRRSRGSEMVEPAEVSWLFAWRGRRSFMLQLPCEDANNMAIHFMNNAVTWVESWAVP